MAPTLSPELEEYQKRVVEKYDQAEGPHRAQRDKWDHYYRQYRTYKDFKKTYSQARGSKVDDILNDGMDGYGPSLHIPYTFSVIETTLPRMLSNNPRLLITPARPEWEDNVESIRLIIDRQQEACNYPLVLQEAGKSGLIFGLGVQKVMWETKTSDTKVLKPGINYEWIQADVTETYAGACAEPIDVYDFIWDPMARSMDNCRWVIHRRWLGKEDVKQRFDSGQWELPDKWTWDDVCGLGNGEARNEIWGERMNVAGHSRPDDRGEHVHEVWEFHTGGEVIVLLDRMLPVAMGPNPYWHKQIPFQIFRPTVVPGEFCGIGEAEAIQDLQREMDELRTTRRNMGRLSLQPPFVYYDGLFDPGDVVFGPGQFFGVDGDPREILQQVQVRDIPNSGWQEEQRLAADIERVTGIDDTTSGGGQQQAQTATGVQLVQAAANVRIQNKTKLCEQEMIKAGCRQWLRLNQQHITQDQVMPGPPRPEDGDKAYGWYQVGPEALAGTYLIEPEGGATQADNPAEKQAKAISVYQTFANDPMVDPRKIRVEVLKDFGFPNPERMLAPPPPELDAQGLMLFAQGLEQLVGIPIQETMRLAAEAQEFEQQQQQEMMDQQPAPLPSGEPPTMPQQ